MLQSVADKLSWMSGARQMESPNHSSRPAGPAGLAVELIVIHCISLPKGSAHANAIHALFLGNLDTSVHESFSDLAGLRVSAHLMIDRSGAIYQYVPFDRAAWHAGESSWRGRKHCNDYSIGIELQGSDDTPFEDAQYRALGGVLNTLFAHFPRLGLQSVVGHCHIAPERKRDPGPHFDWQRLSQTLPYMEPWT